MALFLRLILFLIIIFLLYTAIKYMLSPRRKLELAHEQGKFYFLMIQKISEKTSY